MTDRRPPTSDQFLVAWFEDGPTRMPDRVLDVVTDRIGRERQRPTWRLLGRPFMNTYARLAATAAAIAIVAIIGYNLLPHAGVGPAAPSPTPTSAPTVAPSPTPSATQAAADPLRGSWSTGRSTCAEQNAALQRAGFTAQQLTQGGWDAATCSGMVNGAVHRLQFLEQVLLAPPSGTVASGTLVQRADGAVGWQGYYVLGDTGTFTAGDNAFGQPRPPYISYTYTITGDQLVIDMTDDTLPGGTETDRLADLIAQTVIYESLPFIREQ